MTLYLIEIRAVSSQHDGLAHKLARDIIHLPSHLLPALNASSTSTHPLRIRTAQLYRIHASPTFTTIQADRLMQQLLCDPVIQEAHVSTSAENLAESHVVDVFFHPGVTDTLAESVLMGARMLNIPGLEQVETGTRYSLDSRLSLDEARVIAEALCYNPVIQTYTLRPAHKPDFPSPPPPSESQAASLPQNQAVVHISLSEMGDEQLLQLSKQGMLALNLEEMRVIQRHYRELGREPTDVELETLAQTWSEHCSHKTFKATIFYRELDRAGREMARETIHGLLKQYIMRATSEVQRPWVVSAFSDNAGIMRFNASQDLAFKVETHNHPSAIEPFGGANTGVGGVIRDVLGVSALPIACTDILCFGPLDTPPAQIAPGVLPPRRIASGVINGVRDYGNKMGIPTVNGAVLYQPGYLYNPLVFCGCLGVLPHGSHPHNVQPGDLIVVLGGRTGRDGIHGATFSSGEMSSETHAQAGSAVQIGAPITEKKVTDAILAARERGLYSAITDCGAGGFSSAVGEMGEHVGARVELADAPLKYQGLTPWEIWLSEAQERMVLAVPPQHLAALREICAIEEVEASVIGSFTGDGRLTVAYQGETVADLSMEFLHNGRPERTLEAVWQPRQTASQAQSSALHPPLLSDEHYTRLLLALLHHPNIASKEEVVRRYDHEVQGATVLKPLVGKTGNGPGDAAVLRPILEEPTDMGIVLANGINPLYGLSDPYAMALNAIDEALRNLTAVGGNIERAAILDNFCWGNPTDPIQLGMLVRAVKGCYDGAVGFGVPFISGKDSLNNEYRAAGQRIPVLPTLLISAVGVVDDAGQTVDMTLKAPDNLLYLLGRTRNELEGTYYAALEDKEIFASLFPHTGVPQVDIAAARKTMLAVGGAIRAGLVLSCHDLSEGGLAVAAAEMALAGDLGASLDLSQVACEAVASEEARHAALLFSESASRFLVEVAPEARDTFEEQMRKFGVDDITLIGVVTDTGQLFLHDSEQVLVDVHISALQEAWKGELV